MAEIVYVLINESMPGYVKIGITNTSLSERIKSLDTTSVPLPFECFYAAEVSDARETEKRLHHAFLDKRVRSNREFFEISPEQVVSALQLAELNNVTPGYDVVETEEDKKALDQARSKRSIFNFSMVKIPVGGEISFFNDSSVKATVRDNRTIEFNGILTSLSAAARDLLNYKNPVQGPLYWKYEGETLDQRRRRMEEE